MKKEKTLTPDLQLSLVETVKQISEGKLSYSELWGEIRKNIREFEPKVKAFSHLDESLFFDAPQVTEALHMTTDAMHAASSPQMIAPLMTGRLAGMPIGIKDLFDVKGMPTTAGSKAYFTIPDEDAQVVSKLRAEGAIVFGKTNTQELAFGVQTPPTSNPMNLDYIPGGSSGGSAAAVASGMVIAALGTDTGGSVRIPAACCGLVGFKPTVNAVSKEGVMPLSPTLDHVGFITNTVADARLLYQIARESEHDNSQTALQTDSEFVFHKSSCHQEFKRRLAIPWKYFEKRLDTQIESAFAETCKFFQSQGFELIEIAMEPWEEWRRIQLDIRLPEAYLQHQGVLEGPKRRLLKGDLAKRLDPGRDQSALSYLSAQRKRHEMMREWRQRLEAVHVDAVLMPTLLCPIPKKEQDNVTVGGEDVPVWDLMVCLTAPWNVIGFPAISLPCGKDCDGLPIGLQLIGMPYDDERLLSLAELFMGGNKKF